MKLGFILKTINYVALLAMVFIIPFSKQWGSYFIAVWVLSWIIDFGFRKKNKEWNKQDVWYVLMFVLINIISIFYSENKSNAIGTLQTQLSLIIIPIVLVTANEYYKQKKDTIINIYIIGIIFYVLYILYNVIIVEKLFSHLQWSLKIDQIIGIFRWLIGKLHIHRSYISLHLNLGILFCLYYLQNSNITKRNKFIYVSALIPIFLILILFNSRAALLFFIFLFFYNIIKWLKRDKRFINKIVVIVIFLICISIISKTRLSENFFSLMRKEVRIEQVGIRFSLWKSALIVWKEKPLFGHGIGDAKEELIEVNYIQNITKRDSKYLNCHNQFLETATQTGLLGLITLLLVFAIPLYQSIKKKQELLFLFLMICFINFLFESMLQRLAGVVFFAFWYSFLWFVYYKDEDKDRTEEITSSSNPK